VLKDVIAPPPGELTSETNDNSVAVLLTFGLRPLARRRRGEEEGVHSGRLLHETLNGHQRLETTHSEPRFRVVLSGGVSEVEPALI
jgi:hypothetical protein